MQQQENVQLTFYLRVQKKNKFSPVVLTLFQDSTQIFTHKILIGMSVSSQPDETYLIPYHKILQIYESKANFDNVETLTLSIAFISEIKQGLIFKSTKNQVQVLVLHTTNQNKKQFWLETFRKVVEGGQIINLGELKQYESKSQISPIEEEKDQHNYPIEEQKEQQQIEQSRKFLVFVNPASGKVAKYLFLIIIQGLAQQRWNQASAILQKCGFQFLVVNTEYRNHCAEYLTKIPLKVSQQY